MNNLILLKFDPYTFVYASCQLQLHTQLRTLDSTQPDTSIESIITPPTPTVQWLYHGLFKHWRAPHSRLQRSSWLQHLPQPPHNDSICSLHKHWKALDTAIDCSQKPSLYIHNTKTRSIRSTTFNLIANQLNNLNNLMQVYKWSACKGSNVVFDCKTTNEEGKKTITVTTTWGSDVAITSEIK